MKILVLSATDFISAHTVRHLAEWGHEVVLLHYDPLTAELPASVAHRQIDQSSLHSQKTAFESFGPEVVIDLTADTVARAQDVMETFDGLAQRVVVASSVDVYRAFGRFQQTEPGPPDLVPLLEDDPLREKPLPSGDGRDNVRIERVVLSRPALPATILRLPLHTYGPGDLSHYFHRHLKAMEDGRPQIVLPEKAADVRFPLGYCEDIGYAVALAAKNKKAEGRIYNVVDAVALTLADTVRALGRAMDWKGTVTTAPLEMFFSSPETAAGLEQPIVVDSSRIRQELGYAEQVPFNEAMARTVAWERANPPAEGASPALDYAREDAILARLQAASNEPDNSDSH